MGMRHVLQRLRGSAKRPVQVHRPRKVERLQLESLEERTLLSILFGPQRALTVSDNNGPVLSSAPVRVVFWGNNWNTSGGLALRGQVINSIQTLTAPNGTYFASTAPGADLSQYRPGASARPVIDNFFADSFNSPGATFTANDVLTMLRHEFGLAPNFYYYVIPDPSSDPRPSCGCAAEHTFGTIGSTTTHFGFSRNLPLGTAGQLDDLTILYSHEMVESITDPEGTALQVNPRNPNAWNEIADGEAQLYGYRLNGVWTQAYWSRANNAFTVPTGQRQNFFVSGGFIPRVLTVNGGQLSGNDLITVDANGSDVRITLNGEVAQFEPGQIGSIVVNTGNGNDTINIERTLAGIPVTVNEGSGADTVNVSPSARNLGSIQGGVTIRGGSGVDNLNVNDQSNTASTTYTMAASTVQRPGSALLNFGALMHGVLLNGGGGANTYNVNGTRAMDSTVVNTGTGNDTINVEATTQFLVINETGAGNDTVNVSPSARNLNNIQGQVIINANNGNNTLVVNDQNNAVAQTYTTFTPGSTSIGRTGMAGTIRFNTMNFVTLNGGSGANTYNVNATGAINLTTVNTGTGNDTVNVEATTRSLLINEQGSGNDTVNVSPSARNLNNIQGGITVNGNNGTDALDVNDQNNAATQTYTMTVTSIARTGAASISFGTLMRFVTLNGGSGADTYNVNGTGAINFTTVNTGAGNDTVNVEATTRTLTILEQGSGNDTVNVSPSARNLNNIQGALGVTGNSGVDTLVVNDQNNAAAQTYTMTATTIARTGAASVISSGMSVVTLNGGSGADTYIVTGTGGLNATTLNDGSGGNTVNVQGTSATGLTVNTGANDTVNVGSAASTLDPIGGVTINDASGTGTVNIGDSGFAGVEDYALTSTTLTISRSANFGLTYNGSAALNLTAGPGADIFDIDSTSAATTINAGAGGNCFHISPVTQYLAASILGPLTLNGGGADVLDFFDANDPNAETFSFDGVPSSLTLGSTGTTIATFSGMGSIYVMTNGISTPDDQSGLVVFDPDGGPPCGPGGGSNPNGGTRHSPVDAVALADAPPNTLRHVQPASSHARTTRLSSARLDLLDEVFTQLG